MVDWRHRAKGAALLAAVLALAVLIVARNPGAIGVGLVGLIAVGVLAMLGGLAWLFVTGASGE